MPYCFAVYILFWQRKLLNAYVQEEEPCLESFCLCVCTSFCQVPRISNGILIVLLSFFPSIDGGSSCCCCPVVAAAAIFIAVNCGGNGGLLVCVLQTTFFNPIHLQCCPCRFLHIFVTHTIFECVCVCLPVCVVSVLVIWVSTIFLFPFPPHPRSLPWGFSFANWNRAAIIL